MTKRFSTLVALLGVSLLSPAVARAQTVAEVLSFLITNRSVETGDFDRDRAAAQATSDTISRALLVNLATLPVPSSSSAFVYRLNPLLGTEERSTNSFGPFFLQRALTAGPGQASIGVSFQYLRFSSLDGRSLRTGTLITTANQFVDESAPFDVDQLTLNIDASVATLYANIGVGSRVDLGVAVPLTELRVAGSRVNTYRGRAFTQATASATAIGLADMIVRSKFVLYDEDGAGLAAAADVRLPTGREADLLGTGTSSVRVSAIGSREGRYASAHVNLGYEFGGLLRQLVYGGAITMATSDRVTAGVEVTGRWVDSLGSIVTASAPHPRLAGVETLRLVSDGSAANIMSVAPGVKWNVGDTWVLAASIGVPLTHAGLTTSFTPFIGLDYALGR